MTRCNPRRAGAISLAVLSATMGICSNLHAEVATDGSLGPMQTLPGPTRVLPANLGQQRGSNLFHSLKTLNLSKGESLTFTGPADVANILTRVTGGKSSIDGTLASQIDGANLFLINRDGVVFGPNARLGISGSLVVTTADVVKLKDGGTFPAATGESTLLTSAAPTEFGFLGRSAAGVQLRGTKDSPAKLTTADGKGISILAGEVELSRAALRGPGGWVQATAVGAKANTLTTDAASPGLVTGSTSPPDGAITLKDNSRIDTTQVTEFLPGQQAPVGNGTVNIAGGEIGLRKSRIEIATGLSTEGGRPIRVDAARRLTLRSASLANIAAFVADSGDVQVQAPGAAIEVLDGSSINASTFFSGNAGVVTVVADSILIDTGDGTSTGVSSVSLAGPGASGEVMVDCRRLDILNGGQVAAATFGTGEAGTVTIDAEEMFIDPGEQPVGLAVSTSSLSPGVDGNGNLITAGAAGNIVLRVSGTLRIANGGAIGASTNGSGSAGNVTVSAGRVILNGGAGSRLTLVGATAEGTLSNAGSAGNVTVTTGSLRLFNNGRIGAETSGPGQGGSVIIDATDVDVRSGAGITSSSQSSGVNEDGTAFQTGDAGDVQLRVAGVLGLADGGFITAGTAGTGAGGAISIAAGDLSIQGGVGEEVTGIANGSTSPGIDGNGDPFKAGDAGGISISVDGVLRLSESATINSQTGGSGNAGNISVTAPKVVLNGGDAIDQNRASIFAGSLAESLPAGSAGNVTLNAGTLRMFDGAGVTSDTTGLGAAGNVTVSARDILIDGQPSEVRPTRISSTAFGGFADGGDVRINAGTVRVTNGAALAASATGEGNGGNLSIDASALLVSGTPALEDVGGAIVGAVAGGRGAGNGGTVTINAGSINVRNGGAITAATLGGTGDAGLLFIRAGSVTVDGGPRAKETAIAAGILEGGAGAGGTIDLQATGDVRVRRNAFIIAGTEGSGPGGDVFVRAGKAVRVNVGTISAASGDLTDDDEFDGTGSAGSVLVDAPYIRLEQGAGVSASSDASSGGSIALSGSRLDVLDSSLQVAAATRGGSVVLQFSDRIFANNSRINAVGNDAIGKIDIDPKFTILNNSSLLTDTRPGGGGNIEIVTQQLLQADSTITAAGEIRIDVLNADTDVTAGLLDLNVGFLDESARLKDACGKMTGEGVSSFIVEGRGGVPLAPGMPLATPSPEPKR